MRFFSVLLFVFIVAPVWAQTGEALPDAEKLIAQMSQAIKSLSYRGVVTYERGGELESYDYRHELDGDVASSYLQRLSGKDTLVSRHGHSECGTVGRYLLSGLTHTTPEGAYFGLTGYYRTSLIGLERVAGREAWVIQLLPKDEFRYGVTFTIDKETNLLLRHATFDVQKKTVLERIQFVSLDLSTPVVLDSSPLPKGAAQHVSSERCIEGTYTPSGRSPWRPAWLPSGFIVLGYRFFDEEGHMETYTDGVSSFSVFVKTGLQPLSDSERVQQSAVNSGATMALVNVRNIDQEAISVSVVGEVPLSAAQKIALSIRYARSKP